MMHHATIFTELNGFNELGGIYCMLRKPFLAVAFNWLAFEILISVNRIGMVIYPCNIIIISVE